MFEDMSTPTLLSRWRFGSFLPTFLMASSAADILCSSARPPEDPPPSASAPRDGAVAPGAVVLGALHMLPSIVLLVYYTTLRSNKRLRTIDHRCNGNVNGNFAVTDRLAYPYPYPYP